MITIEQLCQQTESVNNILSAMFAGLQQHVSVSAANEVMPHLTQTTTELRKLYFLVDNLAKQQSNLAYKNAVLKQQLPALETKNCTSIVQVDSLAAATEHENFRLNCDYAKDIQELYRQIEVMQNTVNMIITINKSVLRSVYDEITPHIRSTSGELLTLFFMIGDFVKQHDSLIKENDFLKMRLTNLDQSSYNNLNMQVASLSTTRERENPGLDFDSPEAKQIFSVFSVPPLLISSNAPSSSSSACSSSNSSAYPSPRASLTKDCSLEIFGKPFFYVPPLILSSIAHSSSYSDHSPPNLYSASFIQPEANEGNYRKKSKPSENEQKQLKRTKKHFNLLSLI